MWFYAALLLSFPSITWYLPFPLISSSSLIHSCIPASLTHPKGCWNINSPLMPSAPHPTWLAAPCQGAPLLAAGLQGAKSSASHGQVSSSIKESRNCGEKFQPSWGRRRRHSVKVHSYIPGDGNQYSWYCVFSSQPKSFLSRLCWQTTKTTAESTAWKRAMGNLPQQKESVKRKV